MSQQINLYQAPPEVNIWQEYSPFPQLGLGLLVLLMVVYGYARWSHSALEQQRLEVEQKYQLTQQNIEQLKLQMPTLTLDSKLQSEVAVLAQREQTTRQLLKALNVERIGNVTGFSGYMEGLARRHVKGLWLTRIELNQGGASMGLEGQASKPEAVPQLIQNLGREANFRGIEFDIFNLTSKQNSRLMSFDVRAEQELK